MRDLMDKYIIYANASRLIYVKSGISRYKRLILHRNNMRILLLTYLLIGTVSVLAQNDTILSKFNANVVGDKVLLTWRIKAGNTCNGIDVYRSTDSLNYTLIGSVEGICGNVSFPTDYEYFDVSPVENSKNYYRLGLGGNGFSEVIPIWYFDFSESDHFLSPNPVMENATLRFKNDSGLEVELIIYDMKGQEYFREKTNTDNFVLESSKFEAGEYLIRLQSEVLNSEPISGKVVFVR